MHVMCFYRFSSARQALRFVPSKRRQALPSIDCSSNVCARSSIIPKFEPWFIDLIRCIPSWISVKLLMVKFSFLPRSEDNFVVQYFIHTSIPDRLIELCLQSSAVCFSLWWMSGPHEIWDCKILELELLCALCRSQFLEQLYYTFH